MKKILLIIILFALKFTVLTAQNTPNTEGVSLQPISADWLKKLWDSCTVADYTYFTMPISMSLDQQNSIRQSLRHIGSGQFTMSKDCKQFAKVFYQIKGQIVIDADLFFSENCRYLVFNVNGQKKYANPLSTEGVNFFNQIIARQQAKEKH